MIQHEGEEYKTDDEHELTNRWKFSRNPEWSIWISSMCAGRTACISDNIGELLLVLTGQNDVFLNNPRHKK